MAASLLFLSVSQHELTKPRFNVKSYTRQSCRRSKIWLGWSRGCRPLGLGRFPTGPGAAPDEAPVSGAPERGGRGQEQPPRCSRQAEICSSQQQPSQTRRELLFNSAPARSGSIQPCPTHLFTVQSRWTRQAQLSLKRHNGRGARATLIKKSSWESIWQGMSYSHLSAVGVMGSALPGSGAAAGRSQRCAGITGSAKLGRPETSRGTEILPHPVLPRDAFLQVKFFFLRNYRAVGYRLLLVKREGNAVPLRHGAGAARSTRGGRDGGWLGTAFGTPSPSSQRLLPFPSASHHVP